MAEWALRPGGKSESWCFQHCSKLPGFPNVKDRDRGQAQGSGSDGIHGQQVTHDEGFDDEAEHENGEQRDDAARGLHQDPKLVKEPVSY